MIFIPSYATYENSILYDENTYKEKVKYVYSFNFPIAVIDRYIR